MRLTTRKKAKLYARLQVDKFRVEHPEVTLDTDDIIDIFNASVPCVSIPGLTTFDLLDQPVTVGRVTLRNMSPGGAIWLHEYGKPWFQHAPPYDDWCLAFVLAHCRDAERLESLTTRWKTKLYIRWWIFRCGCSHTALCEAVDAVLFRESVGIAEDVDGEEDAASWNPILAFMVETYGHDLTHWLWHESATRMFGLYSEWANRKRGEHSKDSGGAPDTSDPKIIAVKALQRLIRSIVKKHTDKEENDETNAPIEPIDDPAASDDVGDHTASPVRDKRCEPDEIADAAEGSG